MPALVLCPPVLGRLLQLDLGHPSLSVRIHEDPMGRRSLHFFGGEPEQPLGPTTPPAHPPVGVEQNDSIIFSGAQEQVQQVLRHTSTKAKRENTGITGLYHHSLYGLGTAEVAVTSVTKAAMTLASQ
jgi:hypothetical protein